MAKEREGARPLTELDKSSRERLEALLSVEPAAVTDGDRTFLWGRRAYLTKEQQKDYGVDKAPATPSGDAEGGAYDDMTVDELKDELRNRELKVSGNRDELVERLEADDASGEDEE